MKASVIALVLLTGCASAGPDVGSATMADVQCERFVAQQLGQQVGDLDFNLRPTSDDDAPSYRVLGMAVGGGQSRGFQCDLTFDGDQTWTLDDLSLL